MVIKETKKARRLIPGAAIGLLGLSAPINPASLNSGLEAFDRERIRIRLPIDPSTYYGSKEFLFACASKQTRLAAFEELVSDPDVAAILAVRGGYGSLELLPLIDWTMLHDNPKPVVGFSDFTAFLIAAYKKCPELRMAVHGPSLYSFSDIDSNPAARVNLNNLLALLRGEPVDYNPNGSLIPLARPCEVEAPLIGGNLTMLTTLLGTPWEPDFDGHLVFIEDVGERPYRLHRCLWQLKLTGKFDNVAGVLLGSFNGCDHPQGEGATADDVFEDIFAEYDFPVWKGLACGHDGVNLPLPIGMPARVSNNTLELSESFVLS